MMPIISRRTLDIGKHLFNQTISGWGIDVVLGRLVSDIYNGKAAIIDDVEAKHLKPIDTEEGNFYKILHQANLYPEIELTNLQKIYHIGPPPLIKEI
jgi:hypothetical protein